MCAITRRQINLHEPTSKFLEALLKRYPYPCLIFLILSIGCVSTDKLQIESTAQLVPFDSDEGIDRLVSAEAKVDFFALANQFEAQSNGLYCGPTTAAMIFNTLLEPSMLPKDNSRIKSSDRKYLPKAFDPTLSRHTQESVLAKSPKPKAQVFGKPVSVNGKPVQDFGFQLRQFNDLLRAHGLQTQMRVVDAKLSHAAIVAEMRDNLQRRDDYVVVNYKRSEVGQQGGGHISPIGAYDEDSDSFLILDVNPAKAKWVWMPSTVLVKGMRSFDTIENRGYVLVSR